MNVPAILHEDEQLLVLAKPAGMHVFPSSGSAAASLSGWLIEQRPALAGVGPPGQPALVHRLDGGTSGLVLAAANSDSYSQLRQAFAGGQVEKVYLAVVQGRLDGRREIDLPLGGRYRRSRRVWVDNGSRRLRGVRPARTLVEALASNGQLTLCRVVIHSGARHQIRAHLAHLGHPLLSDTLYGGEPGWGRAAGGFLLHAWRLGFVHPGDGGRREITCPPGGDWQMLLDKAGLAVL